MVLGLPETRDNLATFCWMPLAGVTLAIDAVICTITAYKIAAVFADDDNADEHLDVADWVSLVVSTLQILVNLVAVYALLKKWQRGSAIICAGFRILLGSFIVSVASSWLFLILDLSGATTDGAGPWRPEGTEIVFVVLQVVCPIVLFFLSWWVLSVLKSTQAILAAGGSGWERLNAEGVEDYRSSRMYKISRLVGSFDSNATSIS